MKQRRTASGDRLKAVLALAACAFAGSAAAAASADVSYRAERDRGQAAYRAEWESCRKLEGNARDICQVEAKGHYQVAKAELGARRKHSPANDDKVKRARAESANRVASEKCDDLRANARDVCKLDAKASLVAAQSEAKVSRAAVDKGRYSRQANNERQEARENTNAALFAAARERCGALSGEAQAGCVADAKNKRAQGSR